MPFSYRRYVSDARNVQFLKFFFFKTNILNISRNFFFFFFNLESFYLKLKTVVLQTTSSVKQQNTAFLNCGYVMKTQTVLMDQMKPTVVSITVGLNILL